MGIVWLFLFESSRSNTVAVWMTAVEDKVRGKGEENIPGFLDLSMRITKQEKKLIRETVCIIKSNRPT